MAIVLGLVVVSCGGSESGAGDASGDGSADAAAAPVTDTASPDDSATDDSATDDDASNDATGAGSVGESDLGSATITVQPEGRTFDVNGTCEITPDGFGAGIVTDLVSPGVEVSIGFDNVQSDPDGDFAFNVTAVTSVRDDGTFNVRSRGGLDNDTVMFSGDGVAELIATNGIHGVVRVEFTLTQNGPVTDPTGAPVFDDQPAERTITGDLPCTIGIS